MTSIHTQGKAVRIWTLKCSCGGPLFISSTVEDVDEDIESVEDYMLIFKSKLLAEMYASERNMKGQDGHATTALEIDIVNVPAVLSS